MEQFLSDQYSEYKIDPDEYFLPELLFLNECSKRNLSFIDGCDLLGIALAKLYYAKKVDYLFGDIVANDISAYLISFVMDQDEKVWADKLWEVYLAFDAGEFYRTNKQDEDPAIAEFLQKLS